MNKEDKDFVLHLSNQILAALIAIMGAYFLFGSFCAGIACTLYLILFSLEK